MPYKWTNDVALWLINFRDNQPVTNNTWVRQLVPIKPLDFWINLCFLTKIFIRNMNILSSGVFLLRHLGEKHKTSWTTTKLRDNQPVTTTLEFDNSCSLTDWSGWLCMLSPWVNTPSLLMTVALHWFPLGRTVHCQYIAYVRLDRTLHAKPRLVVY